MTIEELEVLAKAATQGPTVFWNEMEAAVKDARGKALEEAATWHESHIPRLQEQINENTAYMEKINSYDQACNDHCRSSIYHHELAAAAIRALK